MSLKLVSQEEATSLSITIKKQITRKLRHLDFGTKNWQMVGPGAAVSSISL